MLAAVKGYYDGTQIVVDDNDRKNLLLGDELIITILNRTKMQKAETRQERRTRIIDSGAYVVKTGRTVEAINNDIRELRDEDRF